MIETNEIIWYSDNVLQELSQWEMSGGAHMDTSYEPRLILPAGASASFKLSRDFITDSLTQSRYRKIICRAYDANGAVDTDASFSSRDGGVLIKLDNGYSAIDSSYDEHQVMILNKINGTLSEQYFWDFEFIVPMIQSDLIESTITVTNTTSKEIAIRAIIMKRSQDVTQVGENARASLTITSVDAYKDGLKVQFTTRTAPVKMWWESDEYGDFCGIMVDGTHEIRFRRINEILPL